MALFTHKKKRVEFPQLEMNPQQEISLVKRRMNFMIQKNIDISKMTKRHQDIVDSEVSVIKSDLINLGQELKNIRTLIDQAKVNFEIGVKELNTKAKIEDLDHLRRIVQEYDPADFISYEEFQRIAEEKIDELRNIT